jgi:hypothetical protein
MDCSRASTTSDSKNTGRQLNPFRFSDLPYDIRSMVYDYFLKDGFRNILPNSGFAVYSGDISAVTNTLQTSKHVYDEVNELIETARLNKPISIACTMSRLPYAMHALEMIGAAQNIDSQHQQRTAPTTPYTVPKMAILMPARLCKTAIGQTAERSEIPVPKLGNAPLRDFISLSLRRSQRGANCIHFRCVMDRLQAGPRNLKATDFGGCLLNLAIFRRAQGRLHTHLVVAVKCRSEQLELDTNAHDSFLIRPSDSRFTYDPVNEQDEKVLARTFT